MERSLKKVLSLSAICFSSLLTGTAESQCIIPLDSLIYDMQGMGEARPHGTTADWAAAPRVGAGNSPRKDWFAETAWGQIYNASEGNPANNVRVQVRNIRSWLLRKSTGTWTELQYSMSVQGNAYREDFAGDLNVPADIRNEATGGIAVKLKDGYNFHFWPPNGRGAIDPGDIAGLIGVFEARLVVDNPAKPDDRNTARILASGGGDYWRSMSAQWASDWSNNGDWAIGKFKWVRPEWRTFSGHTLTAQQLRANPPPISKCTASLFTAPKDERASSNPFRLKPFFLFGKSDALGREANYFTP